MRRRRTSPSSWKRWLWVGLLAVALQAPLFYAYVFQTEYGGPETPPAKKRAQTILTGHLVRREPPKPPEPPPLPENPQIVEVPEQEEPEDVKPVETKYLANKNTRTEKETRSERVAKPDRNQQASNVSPTEQSEVQSKDSQSEDKTVTSEKDKEIELAKPSEDKPLDDNGEKKSDSVMFQGEKNKLLLPSTSDRAAKANLQALGGQFASDDHVEVKDRSKSTVLNANKYKYADFFYRVKEAVRRHWHPNVVYRRRDPTGKTYGTKDRHTVLHVTLDQRGRLKKLVTHKHSGLEFMDAEAKSAFERAQPFPNPPEGLVDAQGEIKFEFGFFFEISSGLYQFRWRRM